MISPHLKISNKRVGIHKLYHYRMKIVTDLNRKGFFRKNKRGLYLLFHVFRTGLHIHIVSVQNFYFNQKFLKHANIDINCLYVSYEITHRISASYYVLYLKYTRPLRA